MRLYGKKHLRRSSQNVVRNAIETRDAIVWAIYETERYVRVRIQGSDELINVSYPENLEQIPPWLKPGNAVRLAHPAGNQNRLEIIGHANTIPSPLSGDTFPTEAVSDDVILSGMAIKPTVPASMAVTVDNGTFRINSTQYTASGILMGNSDFVMGDYPSVTMGDYSGLIELDTAPTYPNYRVDSLVIGADGVIDYVKGTAATSPSPPSVPADHVLLGHIIVPPGATQIESSFIASAWTDPVLSFMTVTPADDELDWGETNTDLTLAFFDQYDIPRAGKLTIEASITKGNGTLYWNKGSWNEESGSTITFTMTSEDTTETINYTRDQLATDSSPIIEVKVYTNQNIWAQTALLLWDNQATPEPMP